MKIVKYIGGFGNQMFIYAFALALEKHYNESIYSDVLYYSNHKFHNGFELEKVFDIEINKASVKDVLKLTWYIPNYYLDYNLRRFISSGSKTIYEEFGEGYNKKVFELIDESCYYFGFWQNHKYFDNIRLEILEKFKFRNELKGKNLQISNLISSKNSVGIHIRRGDYINHPKYDGICDINYYIKGIETVIRRIPANPVFFIFSNDIVWCKQNISPLINDYNVCYVDWNNGKDSYCDMQLMSLCKALIIANSSFSWWGAYLNNNNPIVVAPRKWLNLDLKFNFTLDSWIKI